MNSEISPVSQPASSQAAAPSSADKTTAGNVAASNAPALNMSDKIGSLQELKTRAPKLWHAMLMGLATSIISNMKRHNDHLKQALRKSRQ